MKKLTLLLILLSIFSKANYNEAPDGTFVEGDTFNQAPDGTYVRGSNFEQAPDGSYIGVNQDDQYENDDED